MWGWGWGWRSTLKVQWGGEWEVWWLSVMIMELGGGLLWFWCRKQKVWMAKKALFGQLPEGVKDRECEVEGGEVGVR